MCSVIICIKYLLLIINFRPQTKQLAIRHQEVIKELNAKMAEKAEAQIRVNETNEELDMVNINVDEIEEEILVLKEQVRRMIFSKVLTQIKESWSP